MQIAIRRVDWTWNYNEQPPSPCCWRLLQVSYSPPTYTEPQNIFTLDKNWFLKMPSHSDKVTCTPPLKNYGQQTNSPGGCHGFELQLKCWSSRRENLAIINTSSIQQATYQILCKLVWQRNSRILPSARLRAFSGFANVDMVGDSNCLPSRVCCDQIHKFKNQRHRDNSRHPTVLSTPHLVSISRDRYMRL